MSNCPHCNKFVQRGYTCYSVNDHPYPYYKYEQSPAKITKPRNIAVQTIHKVICAVCGGIFFEETRHGLDMGGDNKYYFQVYKGGQYRYRDFSTPIILNNGDFK